MNGEAGGGPDAGGDGRREPHTGGSGETRPEREARAVTWYLHRRHGLIKRHTESLELHPDHTARWELGIDLELPTDTDASWEGRDGELLFPFPLVYLKKSETRMQFEARNENGATVLIPTRAECDAFTTAGLAGAVTLLAGLDIKQEKQVMEDLKESLGQIVREKPYQAAMVLRKQQREAGLIKRERLPAKESEAARKIREDKEGLGPAWRETGLEEVLQMLVEHSLIWVLLKGRPGQRRRIVLSEEKILQRRPFVRWAFGELKVSKHWWVRLLLPVRTHRARKAIEAVAELEAQVEDDHGDTADEGSAAPDPPGAMAIEGRPYGRRKRTISLSALGERIGQPMGWMPFEFEFPTIYRMRCASYHLELRFPPGRSPRDLRVAGGAALAEPEKEQGRERKLPAGTRRTLIASTARLDVPPLSPEEAEAKRLAKSWEDTDRGDEEGPELEDDTWFRITVGIGNNAFPILWFLAAAITAVMLWLLADRNPQLSETPAQIVAGILLVVPALMAALAIGSDEVPIAQLIGGARILLLVSGLSAVAGAAVVAGFDPFGMGEESAWACCAMVATAVTVPLGTGWLLSSRVVWLRLKELDSLAAQRKMLALAVVLAALPIAALLGPCEDAISRGCLAVLLLALPVATSVVANDRAAMPVRASRNYISVSFLGVGFTCLVLGCIELRSAIEEPVHPYPGVEWAALGALVLSVVASFGLYGVTRLPGIRPHRDEVHVGPGVGQEMLARERVREMTTLEKREKALQGAAIEKQDEKQGTVEDDPVRRNE